MIPTKRVTFRVPRMPTYGPFFSYNNSFHFVVERKTHLPRKQMNDYLSSSVVPEPTRSSEVLGSGFIWHAPRTFWAVSYDVIE